MTFAADFLLMVLLIGGLMAVLSRSAPGAKPPGKGDTGAARTDTQADKPRERPRPTARQLAPIAAALSFLVPGLGHFLVHSWTRGLIWLAGFVVIGILSRSSHTIIPLILEITAAVDAYLTARWTTPPTDNAQKGAASHEH